MTTKSVDLPHLRSVVLAGHAGAGKTTLGEQLLHRAGAVTRLGKVDDGTSHLDFEPEEQKRRESLSLAVATFETDGTRSHASSTRPGYLDFVAEVISGFEAADGAIFVTDATGGVEAGLEQAVAARPEHRHGRVLLHQQVRQGERRPDRRARRAAGDVRQQDRAAPPCDRRGPRLHGLRRPRPSQGVHVGRAARRSRSPIPDGMADEVARRRDQLLEAAAEADDDVLTKYLEGEEISDPELEACLRKGVKESILAPVLVGSAATGVGLQALLDAIVRYLPSPADEGPGEGDRQGRRDGRGLPPDPDGPLLARVFKTAADPFVGRLTYLRVLSGTLHSQGHAWNCGPQRRGAHRAAAAAPRQGAGADRRAQGGRDRRRREARGDRAPATRSRRKEKPFTLPPLAFPEPTLIMAIEPQTKTDLDKMGPALQRMLEEEPSARVERSEAGEQILRTLGDAQAAVIIERLKRKFGAAIVTHTPRVPYRESIRGSTKAHGRYKKQTGGHGMFGDVWIEIEPNPGGGVEFAEKVVGGSVPRNFFPGVEKGIRETAAEGVFAGYPLSDFKATLYDGSFHTVDSNELSFKIAASMALKDGILAAKPVLLEPIMTVEIRVPEAFMGEVNRDLNGRRGRVLGMDSQDGMQVISAHVPQSELFTYATELKSLTGGRGTFSSTLDRYDEMPAHLADKVVAEHRKDTEGSSGH